MYFRHPEKGLVGVARPPKNPGGSITVRMEAGATVTGRLVDTDGRPRAGVELTVLIHSKEGSNWGAYTTVKTDPDGQFRIENLVPGYVVRLFADGGQWLLGNGPGSGQTRDLGDVRLK